MKKIFLLLCLQFSLLWAREEILDYQVEITVQSDSSLLIREEMTVRAEGNDIKRGIYRDFPVKYKTPKGLTHQVGFQVLSVMRNGEPEKWRVENKGSDQRVYIGNKDVILRPDVYTYRLEYRTTRQLGYFENHDELYYNAIGHSWSFPILKGGVVVNFPQNFAEADLTLDVWTGAKGSQEKNARIARTGPLQVKAQLTRPLGEREGMSIYVEWPKGLIDQPTRAEEWRRLLEDDVMQNPFVRVAGLGLLLSVICYVFLWMKVGRDPSKGVIIPRYEAPAGLSPAGARYLMQMGFDPACMAVTLLSLAAKGWLEIHQPKKNQYELHTTAKPGDPLSSEEQKVWQKLLGGRQVFEIKQKNHPKLGQAREEVKKICKKAHQGTHFHGNTRYMLPGLFITLGTVATFAWMTASEEVTFLLLWLSFWTLGVVALLKQFIAAWRNLFGAFSFGKLIQALFFTAFATPFVGAELFVGYLLANQTSVVGVIFLILQIPIGLIFGKLMKAPTQEGRRLMDELEGLKMYLGTAEVDRLHAMHPPEMTPEHFDAMLPYALALGVEQAWSEAFEHKLAGMQDPRAGSYHPHYYSGTAFVSGAAMCSALGSGLASSFNSAATPPGSSSGGGGGSSGGGGGGGGGGGW